MSKKIQFVVRERSEHSLGGSSVLDIVELGLSGDKKADRRKIMTQMGFMVNKMLDGSWGYDHVTFEIQEENEPLKI